MAKKVMGWKTPKGNRKVETSKPAMAKKETKPATKPTVKRVSKPKRSKFAMSQDAKIKAKKPGWRIAANGNEYYEARPNRSDENRKKKPFLQKGGRVFVLTDEAKKDFGKTKHNDFLNWLAEDENFDKDEPIVDTYLTEYLNDHKNKIKSIDELLEKGYITYQMKTGGGVGKATARPYVQYEYFNTPDMEDGFYVVALGDKVVWLANDVDAIEEWCKEEDYRIGSRDGIYYTKKPKGAKEWDVERFETLDSNGYGEDESPYSGYVLFRKGVPHYVGFSEDEFEDIISGNYDKGGKMMSGGHASIYGLTAFHGGNKKPEPKTPKEGETYLKDLKPGQLFSMGTLEYKVVGPGKHGGVDITYSDGKGWMEWREDAIVTKMKHGGNTFAKEDKEMLHSQNKSVRHHSEEMENVIDKQKHIEPWVVAKMSRATNDMSDLTHYLDGNKKRRGGGVGDIDSNIHIVWDTTQKITDDIRSFIFDSYEAAGEELSDEVIAAIEEGIELAKMDMR